MPTHAEDVENWRVYILNHLARLDALLSSEKSFAQCLKTICPDRACVVYDMAGGAVTIKKVGGVSVTVE